MLTSHLYLFFGEVSVIVFGPFFNQVFVFLLLNFKGSLYILDNGPFSDVSSANVLSQSVACLLIPLNCLLQSRSFSF